MGVTEERVTKQLTFARNASGLTRGLSLIDVFGMGIIDILPLYGIWFMFMAGLALFTGANLFISLGITAITFGVASPIMWGVLGGSMPRSGGDYVYNSRILHPSIALAASMGMILGQFYWNIYMATWITQPSLQMLGQFMGWPGLVNFAESKWGTFACAIVLYIVAFCMVGFSMRVFKAVQRPILLISLLTTAICFLPMLFTSKGAFIANWNAAAAHYGSLNYSSFVAAAEKANGAAFPTTWNWGDTIGGFTAVFMLVIYAWCSVYVGGEVKKPSRSIMMANALGGFVTVALAFLFLFGAYHVAESKFLIAAAQTEYNGGLAGYNFPWASGVLGISFVASGFNRVIGILLSLTWLISTIAIFGVIMTYVSRVLFAWGMDRMGPKFFADVSHRYGTPIKALLFATVICGTFTAAYILWLQNALTGLFASGLMLVTVFLVTAISAIVFPYRKRVRGIWESSPFYGWRLARVPVITIAGVVYLSYLVILIYYSFFNSKTRDVTGRSIFTFVAVWVIGVAWYFFWAWRSKKREIDVGQSFEMLPPE